MEVISSIYNSGYNIKKFYLGSRELNLAYLGNQVIYDEVIGDNDLNYILYEFYGSDTLPNTVEAPVKSAILKGNTKYRDIDTGDILDTFDETKNLELVSVKLPVLTTKNKEVVDITNIVITENKILNFNSNDVPYANYIILEKIPISPNISLAFNVDGTEYQRVSFYDESMNYIMTRDVRDKNAFISPPNARFMRVGLKKSNLSSFFIELNVEKISDNPYKSNILSTPSDLELRGIGDVQDTLDLMTGELVQRTGKFMVDGIEDFGWYGDIGETLYGFNIYKSSIVGKLNNEVDANRPSLCSALEYRGTTMYGKPGTGFAISGGSDSAFLQIVLQKEKLSDTTLDGIKQYLSENPLYFVVPLLDKSIKTVDLTIVDQDGKTINKLNSFNGTTHVSTEVAENSAYPMVSLEVASELQATMSKVTEDIELIKPVQNDIETTIDTQSNDIDSLLLATTELFEMIL